MQEFNSYDIECNQFSPDNYQINWIKIKKNSQRKPSVIVCVSIAVLSQYVHVTSTKE